MNAFITALFGYQHVADYLAARPLPAPTKPIYITRDIYSLQKTLDI